MKNLKKFENWIDDELGTSSKLEPEKLQLMIDEIFNNNNDVIDKLRRLRANYPEVKTAPELKEIWFEAVKKFHKNYN